jgi:outer membrane usher protein
VRATMWMAQGAAVTFAATGGRGPDDQWSLGGYTSVTFGLGRRTHGSTTAARDRTGTSATASVHRSLPVGTGVGYWIQGSATEERSSGSGQLLAHTDFGRYEAYLERSPTGGEGGRVSASGAIVGIGRKLFFTRPITEGFALVRVPGVAGVRAYRESQEIGRTDKDGDVLVPNLLPYYGNRLSIADRDVPEAYLVRETRRSVTVPTRGGALALFDVAPLNAVTGILNVPGPGEAQVPAYGTLAIELVDRRLESPIGTDGRFWLESVPAGHHPAEITWGGGRCGFTFSVPDGAFDVLDVGTIGCAVRE